LPNESRAIQLTYDVRSTADNEESDDEEEIAAGFIPEDMVEYYNYNTGDAEYMKDSDSNSKGNNDIIMTAVKSDLDHFRTKDAYASRLLQIAESKVRTPVRNKVFVCYLQSLFTIHCLLKGVTGSTIEDTV